MDPTSVLSLLGGGLTQGDKGSASVAPVSSSISGPTGFTSGGFTVNKNSGSAIYIIGGIAAIALLVLIRR